MDNNDHDFARLARERAAFHYTGALDRGDMATVATILRQAEDDPALAQIIAEINLVYSATDDAERLRLPGSQRPPDNGFLTSALERRRRTQTETQGFSARPAARLKVRIPLTLSVAVLMFVLLGGIALFGRSDLPQPGGAAQLAPSATFTATPTPSATLTPTFSHSPTALPPSAASPMPGQPGRPPMTVEPLIVMTAPPGGIILPISPPGAPGSVALSGSAIVVVPPNASADQVRRLVMQAVEQALKQTDTLPIQIQIARPDSVQSIIVFPGEPVGLPPNIVRPGAAASSPTAVVTPTPVR